LAGQVITILRKKYATGLFWQPLPAGSNARQYAKSLAKSIGGSLRIFVEYRQMVGLGSMRGGHRSGMNSAAIEVMEAMSSAVSFLAAFATNNGFWVMAARNGVILEDKLYPTEVDAKNAAFKLATLPDWTEIIAPVNWMMPRAVEKHLEDMISGVSKYVLKPVSNLRSNFFVFLALVLICAFIFKIYQKPIMQAIHPKPTAGLSPELSEEYKRQMEEKQRLLDQQFKAQLPPAPQPVLVALVMPYDNLPDPNARAEQCWKAIGFLMQQIPGWTQQEVICGAKSATATLTRGYATLSDLYAVLAELMPGVTVVEKSDSMVTLTVSMPALELRRSVSDLDADAIARDVKSMFQSVGIPANVNTTVETFSNANFNESVHIVNVSVETKLVPKEFVHIFGDFAGFSMPTVKWNAIRRTWNYEVKIYAK